MCCAFISKSTLPYFWQGAFSFCSLSLVCQFLLAGSGCSLTALAVYLVRCGVEFIAL